MYIILIPMIRRMTRRELSYESCNFSYRLPFSPIGYDNEELIQKWIEWAKNYPGGRAISKGIVQEEEYVRFSFLYEGFGEYHPFELVTRLIYLTDMDVVAIQGWVEQDVHDLMDVVLQMDFFPNWTRELHLENV